MLTNFSSETGLSFKEDFIEASVQYENDQMVMNDWIHAITRSQSNRFTATTAPFYGIRVTQRNLMSIERHDWGAVNHSYQIERKAEDHPLVNVGDWTGTKSGSTTANRTEPFQEFLLSVFTFPHLTRICSHFLHN